MCFASLICWLVLLAMAIRHTQSMQLHKFQSMLKESSYEPRENPFAETDQAVNVTVQLRVSHVGPIDSQKLTFQVSTHLNLWWNDHRLSFPNSSHPVTLVGNPKGHIWIPDIVFLNMQETSIKDSLLKHVMTVIHENGNVYMSAQMEVLSPCPMDLRMYPMDSQRCDLMIGSYGYSNKHVYPRWHDEPILSSLIDDHDHVKRANAKLAGYTLQKFSHSAAEKIQMSGSQNTLASFPYLEAMFFLERSLSYYFIRSFLPSTLLVVCSWATFWLPPTSYPARVGLIVTNFLASTFVYQKSSSGIAEVSYVTAMEIYMMLNIFFILLILVEYVIVLQTPMNCIQSSPINALHKCCSKYSRERTSQERSKSTVPNPSIEMKMSDLVGESNPCHEQKEQADLNGNAALSLDEVSSRKKNRENSVHSVDHLARLIVPLIYVLTLVLYFSIYTLPYFKRHL